MEGDLGEELPLPWVTAEPKGRLLSPKFEVNYPLVLNADLIGAKSLAEMEVSWTRGLFAAREIGVFRLPEVYVVGDGYLFDDGLRLIRNTNPGMPPETIAACADTIRTAIKNGTIETQQSPTVITKKSAWHNYGHFLIEMLPMATLGRQVFNGQDLRYLVGRTTPPMQDVMFRAFRRLGIRPDRLLLHDNATPIRLGDAIFVTGLTEHGTYMAPYAVAASASLGRSVQPANFKKIFVKRSYAGTFGRNLLNQDAIEKRLNQSGFITVDPAILSLEEQISIFKGAECVVGPSGAAMTNILFCNPGTSVVSLVAAQFPDTFFWFIAHHLKLHYMEIRGDQATYAGDEAWNSGFKIRDQDIDLLEKISAETISARIRQWRSKSSIVTAHISGVGDRTSPLGVWVGERGAKRPIEGFIIVPPDGMPLDAVQYKVQWLDGAESDWCARRRFCRHAR